MKIDAVSPQNVTPEMQKAKAEDAKLRKACQDFESVFIAYMLKTMRETVPKNDLFGDRSKEEIFQGMMDDEMSKEIAKSDSMGLSDMLYAQLSQQFLNQEKNR